MNAQVNRSQDAWVVPMLKAMSACYRQFQSGSDKMTAGKDYVTIRHELERLGFSFAFKKNNTLAARRIQVTDTTISYEIVQLAAKYLY